MTDYCCILPAGWR